MEPEIRPARTEEMEDFMNVIRLSYGLPQDFNVKIRPEWTLCAFTGGKLATSYGVWPLTLYFAGSSIPLAGVTWVSTHPLYRRRNYLRKVTEAHFKYLYESGEQSIAALQASMAAIYQRYGYGVVSSRNSYSIEPRYLNDLLSGKVKGSLREAGDNEIDLLVELYNQFAVNRVGYLRRGEGMEVVSGTPFTVLNAMPPASLPIKLIYEEAGKPSGYVIYTSLRDTAQNPLGQRIMILDMAWLSPQAYHAIWNYFPNMDLIGRVDWTKVPLDDPLPHLLLEPRKLNLTSADGLLARIVDVARALTQRPYAEDGVLTFELVDELCHWNRGKWKLETGRNGSSIHHTGETTQLTLPVSTLAMLMFGQISPSQAAEMGRLEVIDSSSLPLWDKVMRTPYRPFCADSF